MFTERPIALFGPDSIYALFPLKRIVKIEMITGFNA